MQVLGIVLSANGGDDLVAKLIQMERCGTADAGGGAGDQDSFAASFVSHSSSEALGVLISFYDSS